MDDEAGQRELRERLYQMCAKTFHGEVRFLTAATWKDGLAIIRAQPIDVLLLDLILTTDVPPLGREDTLAIIRDTPDLPPVIVLTAAVGDPFLMDKCILAGCDDFFYKDQANHHPEALCRAAYLAYMRKQRDLRR